ncbi:MAG TPA: [NiFe]-hydrogenase assembly chaperone HybE, partial [Azonexus sp.]|nr:[NiFe]-hydrogenase assembly chaperone HybE [Azonexus sp.]
NSSILGKGATSCLSPWSGNNMSTSAMTQARTDDPSAFLERHYQQLWALRSQEFSDVNLSLQVAALGFSRLDGDWLGVMITPWSINLLLLSGGGTLWGDIPVGQSRYLELPCGTVKFIADDEPGIGPLQYSPLISPVTGLADMAAARQLALASLAAIIPPPPEQETCPHLEPGLSETPPQPLTRRGFLRRLSGKR